MFSSVVELVYEDLLQMNLQLTAMLFFNLCDGCKPVATLSKHKRSPYRCIKQRGTLPEIVCDDIGRHNAVDKAIVPPYYRV